MTDRNAAYLTTLHQLLNRHFSLAEIRTICFKLNVDYDSLAGEEKPSKIRELILRLGREEWLSELVDLVQKERPNVEWTAVPDDFELPHSLSELIQEQKETLNSTHMEEHRTKAEIKKYEEHSENEWDVFISYASEDRDIVATPLARALRENGIKVWYDQFELKIGDSLFESISKGLLLSKFGILILSPSFFAKKWTKRELRGLFSRTNESNEREFILPIWYKIGQSEIEKYSPILSDIVAARWENGLNIVIQHVISVISANDKQATMLPTPSIPAEVRQILAQPDFKAGIKEIVQKHSGEAVGSSLKSILFDIEQPILIRIRSLQELLWLKDLEPKECNDLLREPNTTLLSEIVGSFTDSDILLSEEQLHSLFANPALPRKSSGLGKMVISFIEHGADYTSKVFTPLATYPSWEIKYDCVKSIIMLDDEDSIQTLQPFLTMSYWQPRRRTAKYILGRFEEGRLSYNDKEVAQKILTQIIKDGKTEERTPTMRKAKEALETITNS